MDWEVFVMEERCYPFPVESDHAGDAYREAYLAGVERLVERELDRARERRRESFAGYLENPQEYRERFVAMLGWPLTERRGKQLPKAVEVSPVGECQGIRVERVKLEVLPGIPFYGVLFRNGGERRPLVIAQHGGGGTPELCSGLLERGTVNYNDMTGRILRYGVHVFAPQLLLWDPQQFQSHCEQGETVCQVRRSLDQGLKLIGGSITALELTCLMGALDYFEAQEYVDSEKLGMVGLSYGGFYTQYLAAVDTRIKSALSSCFFNRDHYRIGSDYGMYREALQFMHSEIAMLVHPRRLSIQVASRDEILPIEGAREEYSRLAGYAAHTQGDWLRFTEFDGVHEFWRDDAPIAALIEDLYES